MIFKRIAGILLGLVFWYSSFAGKGTEERKVQRQAENHFQKEEYTKALPLYLQLDSVDQNPMIDYRIGVCYYHLADRREDGIDYLERCLQQADTLNEARYYLAQLYHLKYDFDRAIEEYHRFKEGVIHDNIQDQQLLATLTSAIDYEIERCSYGKIMLENPREVIIENLGEEINTEFAEYAPVISVDEKELIYTGRKPGVKGNKISPDGDYYEDIYRARLLEGSIFDPSRFDTASNRAGFFSLVTPFQYSMPKPMGENINSSGHEGAIQLSPDGEHLYFYHDFDVWKSKREDTTWSKAERLGKEVNSKAYEPSVAISLDEQVMFIVSDKEGGFGGLDLYRSERLPDGTWSSMENLGPSVNTPYDEDAPYVDPNGKTLYFSSKGHSSMGGYDVFKTHFENGKWHAPMNMGFPVNTPADDIFFVMTPRYNRAYYSSDNLDGYGGMDLYRLTFANERNPLAEIKGLVLEGDSLVPAYSQITLLNAKSIALAEHESDSVTGDYLLLVAHGKEYDMLVETSGFLPYRKKFTIPEQRTYFQLYQEIHHVYLYDAEGNIIGQQITVHNAFFDVEGEMAADTLKMLYDKNHPYSEYLKNLEEHQNYEKMTDVKFYITEDSLALLMSTDSTLRFDFPPNATISYLKDGKIVTASLAEGELLERSKFSNVKDVVLNNIENEKEIERIVNVTTHNDSIPSLVLLFDFNGSSILNSFKQELDAFSNFLKNNQQYHTEVIGHTDGKGEQRYNLNLSKRRAKTVMEYLKGKGIAHERITMLGLGESDPVAPNQLENGSDNPEGRRLNRRVEFKLIRN